HVYLHATCVHVTAGADGPAVASADSRLGAPVRGPSGEYRGAATMNRRARQLYDMLVRVRTVGAGRGEQFSPGSAGRRTFDIVDRCVHDVVEQAIAERSSRINAVSATASKMVARRVLRKQLDAIVRTARALALDSPGFDEAFRLPRGNGDRRLLRVSRSLAQRARKRARRFIPLASSTFLDEVDAGIDAFEGALCRCRATRRARVAASAAVAASLADGFLAVRRLDAVVPNILGADPGAIAAWRRARRVARTRRSRRQGATSASQPSDVRPLREMRNEDVTNT